MSDLNWFHADDAAPVTPATQPVNLPDGRPYIWLTREQALAISVADATQVMNEMETV